MPFLNFIDASSLGVSDVTAHLYDCAFAPSCDDPVRLEQFVEIDREADMGFACTVRRIAESIGEWVEGLYLRDHRPHIIGEIVIVLIALFGSDIEQLLEQRFKIMARIFAYLACKFEDCRLDRQLDALAPQRE